MTSDEGISANGDEPAPSGAPWHQQTTRGKIGLTLLTPDSSALRSPDANSPSMNRPTSMTSARSRTSDAALLRKKYDYVFLDFDHVITSVMLGMRSKNTKVSSLECISIKEFGGEARVEKLRELFELWQSLGINFFVISKGRLNRIEACLERVNLLKYLENKIYAIDSNPCVSLKQKSNKRNKIMNVLGSNPCSPHQVLFIDDCPANLTLAEDVCVVYQPESGEGGKGLSMDEICCLVNGAKVAAGLITDDEAADHPGI